MEGKAPASVVGDHCLCLFAFILGKAAQNEPSTMLLSVCTTRRDGRETQITDIMWSWKKIEVLTMSPRITKTH